MAIKISTGMRDDMLDTGSLRSILNDGFLKIYGGTVPATADAALDGATLLVTISDTGGVDGLDFEATASNGILAKAVAQTWSGTNAASGTAAFYRFVTAADDGTLSTTQQRIQGTVDIVGADLNLSSTALTAAAVQTIDYYVLTLPASA